MLAEFFTRNIIGVFFFYGLSFFSMGLAILLEISRSSQLDFARALRPLSWFGLIHGSHEWFEMFLLIKASAQPEYHPPVSVDAVRLVLLASSFFCLIAFGVRLITGAIKPDLWRLILLISVVIWLLGLAWVFSTQPDELRRTISADVYTRYSLAIPGAALTVWGLLIQRRQFYQAGMQSFGRDVALAALAFGFYGGIGQLFASPSSIFPSQYLNALQFIQWFGFPVQVFRAAMACMAAVFIIRSLRAFEVENQRQINTLREAQLAERRRLEELRADLLHRTVETQEAERQRIAQELHDETGQSLTALGLGLRGLRKMIENNPQRAKQQAEQLQSLATDGLEELQRMVAGLRPPHLDDLGLLAALRWYASETMSRFGLPVNLTSTGNGLELPLNVRVVLFRIAQEAITNVVRHANASHADIRLSLSEAQASLQIEDDGQGFNVQAVLQAAMHHPCWGLLGMMERATLVGGVCKINSQPGAGTRVEVQVKLNPGAPENV
ncbi:MAG TPA: sensor histidine kinase [Anaerolineales bacterium]|nr:sensor histidine kinase [Anaerolineales bacterium]